jgi:hypothetical protein
MAKVTLWNLKTDAPETIEGEPIIVETDRPEHTAEQMLRNREVRDYEARISLDQEQEIEM